MYWVEIRSAIQRVGPPRLVPLEDVHLHTGFRSVFAYDDETANMIREAGTTKFLRGHPVYADTLFVDFDSTDPSAFRQHLIASGLAYQEFDSGNRSAHFHVPMVPVFGSWVPGAIKQWVKKHAPTADMSFYHPAGQYRLPGTFHYKRPGRCKVLVDSREGVPLNIQQPARQAEISFVLSAGEDRTEAEGQLFLLLTQACGEGHRSGHIWKMSACAAEAGLSFEDALDHLRFWNRLFALPPHDDTVLQKHCESAYRRHARKVGA